MTQSNPGGVKIYAVKLQNKASGAVLDISLQVKNISIFESIYDPTIFCEILMEDSVDLWRTFPIQGEEDINISFKTPAIDEISSFDFKVFKVKNKIDTPNSKTSSYVLECVSRESMYAIMLGRVNGTFNDPIENIITLLLKNYLNSDRTILVEKTKGLVPLTLPNLYCFQAINFLKDRAVSADVPNSSFLFFENQHGFNFRTIESLLKTKRDDIGSKEFTYDNSNVSPNDRARTNSYRNILVLEKNNIADSVKNIGEGGYKNVVENFDMITKQVDKVSLDFSKKANQFTSSDKLASPLNTQAFFTNFNSISKKAKTFFGVKDSSLTTNLSPDALGNKIAYKSMFNTLEVDILVYGDSSLTVGETLKINTKNVKGTTERNSDEAKLSGTYLISHLRHIVSPGPGAVHYTAMKLQKMGYSV